MTVKEVVWDVPDPDPKYKSWTKTREGNVKAATHILKATKSWTAGVGGKHRKAYEDTEAKQKKHFFELGLFVTKIKAAKKSFETEKDKGNIKKAKKALESGWSLQKRMVKEYDYWVENQKYIIKLYNWLNENLEINKKTRPKYDVDKTKSNLQKLDAQNTKAIEQRSKWLAGRSDKFSAMLRGKLDGLNGKRKKANTAVLEEIKKYEKLWIETNVLEETGDFENADKKQKLALTSRTELEKNFSARQNIVVEVANLCKMIDQFEKDHG